MVGQPVPGGFANGQQTHTHLLVVPTVTIAVLTLLLMVPGSPVPVSPSVWCQSPRMNVVEIGVAVSVIVPGPVIGIDCIAALDAVPPLTVTLHQILAFFTVNIGGPASGGGTLASTGRASAPLVDLS